MTVANTKSVGICNLTLFWLLTYSVTHRLNNKTEQDKRDQKSTLPALCFCYLPENWPSTVHSLYMSSHHCVFVFQWFLANLSYQEALSDVQVAIVNILSSTSGDSLSLCPSLSLSIHTAETYPVPSPSPGLFTLILAAIFPSNSSDRFTLSKLLAVALRWGLNEHVVNEHYIVLHCVIPSSTTFTVHFSKCVIDFE